jgi:hypothetical protein
VTSELSPIIDMDEVIFNSSKPIGDGGYGTVYRGTVRISFLMEITHIHTHTHTHTNRIFLKIRFLNLHIS